MREALPRQGFTHPSRNIFTHLGGVMPRLACRLPRASDGSPPDCAVTAQIAHIKYAAQYARLVRTLGVYRQQVRTEVRTLLREPGANPASGDHAGYHGKLPMRAVARRWFPLWFPGFCSVFH